MKSTQPLGRLLTAAAIACAYALAVPAHAHAQNDRMTPIATPAQPDAIVLGTGPLPGAQAHESWHNQYGSLFARNVTVATLTPFLPDPAKASGAAVIVAPGCAGMAIGVILSFCARTGVAKLHATAASSGAQARRNT